jgi:copper chaperone CopZ
MKKQLFAIHALAGLALLVAGIGLASTAGALAAEERAATVTSLFKVEGMTCGGCEAAVERKVKKLDGVAAVEASHEEGRARVTYDPKRVTPQRIVAAIEELGYSAELIAARGAGG